MAYVLSQEEDSGIYTSDQLQKNRETVKRRWQAKEVGASLQISEIELSQPDEEEQQQSHKKHRRKTHSTASKRNLDMSRK